MIRALCEVQRIDRYGGKRAFLIAFFAAPAVVGGPVVTAAAAAAPVLLGVATVLVREAPTPAPVPRGGIIILAKIGVIHIPYYGFYLRKIYLLGTYNKTWLIQVSSRLFTLWGRFDDEAAL